VSKWRTERIPTVYRLNLKDPSGFFLAQHFPIENNDLVYVSTASYVDVSLIAQLMGSFSGTAANVNAAQR
jgi:polysaccharide export outer membrane protein